ncbi:6-phosphofructokinase, partial [bacterium]|nr:6-phosphofructokinase [bacterium]
REMPLQIYLAETDLSMEDLADNVNEELIRSGRVIVVISEGFHVGDIGEAKDAFGHTEFGASQSTVSQTVVNYLNKIGLKAMGSARGFIPGTDQRDTAIYASTVDLDEAYKVGQKAALIAYEETNGFMSTILRKSGSIYSVEYGKVLLEQVANTERKFPSSWIAKNKIDVTDEFVKYARPLIGDDWVSVPIVNGIQRFSKIKPIFAEKKCAEYIPQTYK